MKENVYATPKSDVQVQVNDKGSAIKAIGIGLIVDIGGTIIFGIVFAVLYGIYMASKGMNAGDIDKALQNIELLSSVGIITIGGGLIFSVLGGYTCARTANHNEYKYSAILGAVVCLFGVTMGASMFSSAENIIMSIITFIAVMGGTYLYTRKKT